MNKMQVDMAFVRSSKSRYGSLNSGARRPTSTRHRELKLGLIRKLLAGIDRVNKFLKFVFSNSPRLLEVDGIVLCLYRRATSEREHLKPMQNFDLSKKATKGHYLCPLEAFP
jgi:hypothetical protein